MERLLLHLKNTSSGLNNIPCWVFRKCSVELADAIAFIINYSLPLGVYLHNALGCYYYFSLKYLVLQIWVNFDHGNTNIVQTCRKVQLQIGLDLHYLKLLCKINLLLGFRAVPLVHLQYCLHHVTLLLETNSYVHVLLVDFSKAFDIVNHAILITKILTLGLPDNINNWIISFLIGRTQVCKIDYTFCQHTLQLQGA